MIKRIKIMTDYLYFPLWEMDDVGDIDPTELPLSQKTIDRLLKWQNIYDNIMNWDDPASADFASENELLAFEQEGVNLWQIIQHELGADYQIYYFSQILGKLIAAPQELLVFTDYQISLVDKYDDQQQYNDQILSLGTDKNPSVIQTAKV